MIIIHTYMFLEAAIVIERKQHVRDMTGKKNVNVPVVGADAVAGE